MTNRNSGLAPRSCGLQRFAVMPTSTLSPGGSTRTERQTDRKSGKTTRKRVRTARKRSGKFTKFEQFRRKYGTRRNLVLYLVVVLSLLGGLSIFILTHFINHSSGSTTVLTAHHNRKLVGSSKGGTAQRPMAGSDVGARSSDRRNSLGVVGGDGVRAARPSQHDKLKQLLLDKKKQSQYVPIEGISLTPKEVMADDAEGMFCVQALLDHIDVRRNNNIPKKQAQQQEVKPEIPRMPRPTATTRKVFGIGLSKTGTTSLADGLRRMGLRTIHNDMDRMRGLVVFSWRPVCSWAPRSSK